MIRLIAVLALIGLFGWLVVGRAPRPRAPEDGLDSPIDRDELEAAERELREDPRPRSLGASAEAEEEDDWGPGAGR